MKKIIRFSFKHSLILILFYLFLTVKSIQVYEINEDIPEDENYKKVSFESDEKTTNHYFKYQVHKIPQSRIGAFRVKFEPFNQLSLEQNQVYCTFVDMSATDDELVNAFEKINDKNTNCIGQFNINGIFEGIIKYDETKTKLGIMLITKGEIAFKATVYIKTTEKSLEAKEQKVEIDETYSLVPFTLLISDFRELTSKILLYSHKKELQMYYVEKDIPYPEKLFSGNILSIYTSHNMVHQKYHDANYMVLLTRDFAEEEDESLDFKFQVLFPSSYLLDYFVSNNPMGRSKNSPLAINMTECGSPYYFILNYNKPEKETSLYIDQIYGKIKSLSVSFTLNSNTWEDMIKNDMQDIQVSNRRFTLPKESDIHMDIYKLECEIPFLLNFYYVDETADIPNLDYGQVAITTLKPYQILSLPFNTSISKPKLTIEIFNPSKKPLVYVSDGENEVIINKNYLIEKVPESTENPITFKEKNGEADTRIIIKVGYNIENWVKESSNDLFYNPNLNMYVFAFPNDEKKLNYTSVNLVTRGVIDGDNVKYCYGTNLGSAIIPSYENCYRISKDNSETIKLLNPFVMYKDYEIDNNLVYYISIKPVVLSEKMEIIPELNKYNINERNIEGVGNNIMIDSSGKGSTILTPPINKDASIFVQVQHCNLRPISISVSNTYNNQIILPELTIPEGTKNFYHIMDNTFFETVLDIKGESNSNVFVKHAGVWSGYSLDLRTSQEINFIPDLNQLEIESPFNNYEPMKYIVFVSESGEISNKNITLCSFIENQEISPYNITVLSNTPKISVNIIFNKIGLKPGDPFEVLVYSEQQYNSKMAFLSDIFNDTVGEIKTEVITEINTVYEEDKDYVYAQGEANSNDTSYYYSYLPEEKFDVPVGAFSIELDNEVDYGFSRVDCAFVDKDADAESMVAAIQDVIDSYNSYCMGGKSQTNGKIYNFIFRYIYKVDTPKKLVIKLSNDYSFNSSFNIYIKKGENTKLEPTDFEEQKEYGKGEENKKSVIPYIVDLDYIRGKSETDYISKILLYSQHLEMQMYYLDESGITNAPTLLFTGNIMLLYTKLALAQEKYHTTKLILLSENIRGQEHPSLENQFRFHTKMFKSDAQVEYFFINNHVGFFNYPLSLQINKCTEKNSKYYYILNYNKVINDIILYLDLIFGSMKKARIINETKSNNWDTLIKNDMIDIDNYQISLAYKPTHIDIIEIECNTPLLLNAYYTMDRYYYYGLKNGDFVIKNLKSKENITFTLDTSILGLFHYSFSLFNPVEKPDITIIYKNTEEETFKENSLHSGILENIPENITVINNGETPTRFIYKIGYGVESGWNEEKKNIEGKLYYKDNKYVYKFPEGENEKNFTNVLMDIMPMKSQMQEEPPSVKFCYSTSIGFPIDVSYENCFRTGANMPYSLTFINPLIEIKNYKSYSNDYYITLSPYYPEEYISLEIKENKYDVKERNFEGVPNVLKIGKENEKSTILSIPEIFEKINSTLLQVQLCSSSKSSIKYQISNAYTHEEMEEFNLDKKDKLNIKFIKNYLIENELKFIGEENDEIFTKHMSLDYKLDVQPYKVTFNSTENKTIITRPILNEAFNITILIGKKGRFNDYTLCTFVGKSESQYKLLGDYVTTIKTDATSDIIHNIDFPSFNYKEGDEFDLLVYAVQINNPKLEILYDVISEKVRKNDKEEDRPSDKNDSTNDNKDDSSNLALILGIGIAVFVLIIIIVIFIIIRYNKKKKNNIEKMIDDEKEMVLPMKEV